MTSDTDRTELVRAIRAASERHTDAETTRRIREHLDAGGNMEDIL